jgi:hypothetical protein
MRLPPRNWPSQSARRIRAPSRRLPRWRSTPTAAAKALRREPPHRRTIFPQTRNSQVVVRNWGKEGRGKNSACILLVPSPGGRPGQPTPANSAAEESRRRISRQVGGAERRWGGGVNSGPHLSVVEVGRGVTVRRDPHPVNGGARARGRAAGPWGPRVSRRECGLWGEKNASWAGMGLM